MQDFEKALEKFLKKRDLVLKRMEDDKTEIEKLNSQIAHLQLSKIKSLLGCDERGLLEIINQHPEQLEKLKKNVLRTMPKRSDRLLYLMIMPIHLRIEFRQR